MSMETLLQANRDLIRSQLNYTAAQCEVMPDGQPPPMAGEEFVAVHPDDWTNTDDNPLSLDEIFGICVTLTFRVGYLPVDRTGSKGMLPLVSGWYARAGQVRALLHANYTAINNANTLIGATENGFIEPLSFRSGSVPQARGPDWFWSEDDRDPAAGYTIELRFGGARRKQVIEEQS